MNLQRPAQPAIIERLPVADNSGRDMLLILVHLMQMIVCKNSNYCIKRQRSARNISDVGCLMPQGDRVKVALAVNART